MIKKIFDTQTPGKRIAPPQAGDNDAKYGLRLDAGETHDGKKTIYLQVNTQAKSDALKNFKKKNGTHANLATGTIDVNTPEEDQKKVAEVFWKGVSSEAKSKLG